jgi:Ca-activated chloride channel homolog
MRSLLTAVLIGVLFLGTAAGDRAFRQGDYATAVAEYQRALERGRADARLHYNLGTALLRLQRYEEARRHLALAAEAEQRNVRQAASYNAGNAELEPAFAATHSPERVASLERAIADYKRALLLDPADVDAKWNLELAQRLLAMQGGGGGADDPQRGGGGGGAGQDEAPARPDPSPAPAAAGGQAPRMTPAEAERLLESAAQQDRQQQEAKLGRGQAPPPSGRDW